MKTKFPRAAALAVARELCTALQVSTMPGRLIVAGSLRRGRLSVGDVEIVFVPRTAEIRTGLFTTDTQTVSLADQTLEGMVSAGVLARRKNVNGSEMWGAKNKLALHVRSGIPVDLFATTEEAWFNYLVCRTGPAESNTRIAMAAQDKGWKWNPYGPGFSRGGPLAGPEEIHRVTSEEEVFTFVGLPCLAPQDRR